MYERQVAPAEVLAMVSMRQARRATAQASELLGERIRLARKLGQGATAQVWEGHDVWSRERVAVKMLSPSLAADSQALERFDWEKNVLIHLQPVLGLLRSTGTFGGVPYLELSLATGEPLSTRLDTTGPLDRRSTAEVVGHVLRQLSAVHERGIVHRDVKPANVVVSCSGGAWTVTLVDFGIAAVKHEHDLSDMDAMAGTAPYMGPEQLFRLGSVHPRMDLWSAAVMAYECLTGRLPFGDESIGAICVAVDAATFVAPSAFDASLPAAIDAWFSRAFQRDPLLQFQSATEMAESWRLANEDLGCGAPAMPLAA